jgi:D-glycero-alpha-D-manno-heptose-7-phosphate kinase
MEEQVLVILTLDAVPYQVLSFKGVHDEIYQEAINAGALAGKISGAGGGGFMLFFVNPFCRLDVMRVLRQFDGQVSNCHFTKQGVQSWRLG